MTNTLPTVKEYSKATYKSPSTIYSRLKTNPLYSTSEGKRKRLTQAYLDRYGTLDGFGSCTFDDLADLAQEYPDCAELELLRLHNNGSKVLLPPVKEASAREVVLYSLRHKDIAEDVLVLLCWAAKERYPAMFKALYNSLTADDYNRQEAADKAEKVLEHPMFAALLGEDGREELRRQIRIAEADKTLGIHSVVVGSEEDKQLSALSSLSQPQQELETTEQVIGGLVVELRADESFRVRIQPGIYSRRYTTEDIEQVAEDFPTLAEALVMEGYRALPRVRMGDETIVNLNGSPVREHNGLVYLDDVMRLFTEED